MEDLISRQAAYKVLTDYYHHRTEIQHIALREALERVPSVDPEPSQVARDIATIIENENDMRVIGQRWIPVSERLPDEKKDVFITTEYAGKRYVDVGCLIGDEWCLNADEYATFDYRRYRKHLAWMPLPEPWKGEE